MRADVAIAYLRDQIENMTGLRPAPDRDGNMPVVFDDVLVWLSVKGGEASSVRVVGVVSEDVLLTTQVHRWTNDLNGRLAFARAWCTSRTLLVGTELWGDDLTPQSLSRALDRVVVETRRAQADFVAFTRARPRSEDRLVGAR